MRPGRTAALALPAYAKLNLDLRVLGVRPDGRHQVETTLQLVSLHDLLLLEEAPLTELEGGTGEDDLVLRAQRALESAAGRPLPTRFRLVKRIPAGAGLGGGSSDAAAALRGLVRLHDLRLGTPELLEVATQLGADVPFFLLGGAARAGGCGERLTPLASASGWFALAWPGYGVPTGAVYRMWDEVGGEGPNQLLRAAQAAEPRLVSFAAALGEGWQMTGSGSAFFRACASRLQAEAAVAGLECWTAVVQPVGPAGA